MLLKPIQISRVIRYDCLTICEINQIDYKALTDNFFSIEWMSEWHFNNAKIKRGNKYSESFQISKISHL